MNDDCEFAVIVVARMSSRRLPGKTMMQMTNRTVLGHVLSRVEQSREAQKILVATSTHSSDDPIMEWCAKENVTCFRGSLSNVALRVSQASLEFEACNIVRISADSPFIDPALIDFAIKLFRHNAVDLVTNVFPRTFPVGQSVEVFSAGALERILFKGLTSEQEEHVTKAFYDLASDFRILNFYPADVTQDSSGDHSAVHLSIDSPEDLVIATRVAKLMGTRLTSASWLDMERVWLEVTESGSS